MSRSGRRNGHPMSVRTPSKCSDSSASMPIGSSGWSPRGSCRPEGDEAPWLPGQSITSISSVAPGMPLSSAQPHRRNDTDELVAAVADTSTRPAGAVDSMRAAACTVRPATCPERRSCTSPRWTPVRDSTPIEVPHSIERSGERDRVVGGVEQQQRAVAGEADDSAAVAFGQVESCRVEPFEQLDVGLVTDTDEQRSGLDQVVEQHHGGQPGRAERGGVERRVVDDGCVVQLDSPFRGGDPVCPV